MMSYDAHSPNAEHAGTYQPRSSSDFPLRGGRVAQGYMSQPECCRKAALQLVSVVPGQDLSTDPSQNGAGNVAILCVAL